MRIIRLSHPPSTGGTRETGELDCLLDSPQPYGYFHGSGRICAPWNRLASMEDGPHPEWKRMNWQENPQTRGDQHACRDDTEDTPRTP